jgi:hypothetical protein
LQTSATIKLGSAKCILSIHPCSSGCIRPRRGLNAARALDACCGTVHPDDDKCRSRWRQVRYPGQDPDARSRCADADPWPDSTVLRPSLSTLFDDRPDHASSTQRIKDFVTGKSADPLRSVGLIRVISLSRSHYWSPSSDFMVRRSFPLASYPSNRPFPSWSSACHFREQPAIDMCGALAARFGRMQCSRPGPRQRWTNAIYSAAIVDSCGIVSLIDQQTTPCLNTGPKLHSEFLRKANVPIEKTYPLARGPDVSGSA